LAENALDRNFGSRKTRGRENWRIKRDRLIDRQLRKTRQSSILKHRYGSIPVKPLSPYLGVIAPFPKSTRTAFPMTHQWNGRPMPPYKDTSWWFKFDLLAIVMQEYGFVEFTIHVHPKLEQKWIKDGRDPKCELGERVGDEVRKIIDRPAAGWEYAICLILSDDGHTSQKHGPHSL